MNLTGPMLIELHDRRGEAVLIADRDSEQVTVFERQPDGQPLRQLSFPSRLTPEQMTDAGQIAVTFQTILYNGGWRELVLDEAEQRRILLAALCDVTVRFLELKVSITQAHAEALPRPFNRQVH